MAVYNQTALRKKQQGLAAMVDYSTGLSRISFYLFILYIFISDIFCNSVLISVLTTAVL